MRHKRWAVWTHLKWLRTSAEMSITVQSSLGISRLERNSKPGQELRRVDVAYISFAKDPVLFR